MKKHFRLSIFIPPLLVGASAFAQRAIPQNLKLIAPISKISIIEKATRSIESSSTIKSGDVIYRSGGLIQLVPGFHVAEGSFFSTEIVEKLNEEKSEIENDQELTFKVYPNPFAERTQIEYYLTEESAVTLALVDLKGIQVSKPIDGQVQSKGHHTVDFEPKKLPSGIYTCVLETNSGKTIYKIVKL